MTALVVAVIIYIFTAAIWGRIYFRRRHGVGMGVGLEAVFNPGTLWAFFIGLAWPATIFTHRAPEWCRHRSHVLERGAGRAELEAEEEQYQQGLRSEGRQQ